MKSTLKEKVSVAFVPMIAVSLALCVISTRPTYSLTQFTARSGSVPAEGQSFYLDLDTMDGHFSEWRHDDIQLLSGFSANASIRRISWDAKWLPAFTFALQDAGTGQESNVLALQILSLNHKLPLNFRIARKEKGKAITEEPFKETIGLNDKFDVQIDWSARESVTITINQAEVYTHPISWPVESVLVAASTGQMKIDPIVFFSKKR